MSFNIEKENSPKTLFVNSLETSNEDDIFRVSRNTDTFMSEEPSNQTPDIGLDFLTGPDNASEPEQEDPESDTQQSEYQDHMMNEYNPNSNNEPELSYEDLQQRKAFALYNLNRYKSQGYVLSRHFTTSHSLEELECEVLRIEKERDLDNGLRHCKDVMLVFTKAVETVNTNYGPNWIKLNGWSKFILEEYKTHKYDDCFIKLWQKYSAKLPDSPEFTLIWLLGCSAFTFHMAQLAAEDEMSRRKANSIPEMKQPSTNYDDLMKEMEDMSDTSSQTSEMSVVDAGISVSIPDLNTPKKKRGRPKKTF